MKIPTSINVANTILSTAKKNNHNTVAPKGKINVSDGKKADSFKTKQDIFENKNADEKQLVRNLSALSSLSKEEKADAIHSSYIGMQNCLRSALDGLEIKRYCFNSLKEQKAYYTSLMENDGVISEERGKYNFFDKTQGAVVDMKDIESALSDVQRHINNYLPDNYLNNIDDVILAFSDLDHRLFKEEAAIFSAVTEITDDALILNDESLKRIKSGLTEENYLERITEDINSIKNRSKQITDIMVDYAAKNDDIKERMNNPAKPISEREKNPHLEKVLEEYRKCLYI